MTSLTDLYIGAGTSPTIAKRSGAVTAATASGHYFRTKRRVVLSELASGTVKKSQLSVADLAAVGLGETSQGPQYNDRAHSGSLLNKVGGFFGNLGKDVGEAALGLPQGVYTLGKALAHDVSPFADHTRLELYDKILKPTFEHYKETYGSGNVLQNIYEHPLGPILDVATLATGGAAGAAKVGKIATEAGNTGRLSRLANLTSTEGRPGITLPGATREIAREYTPRPLAHAGQIGLDKLGASKFGEVTGLGEFQARRASALESRLKDQEFKGSTAHDTTGIVRPIALTARELSDPDVALAYSLAIRGVNTPERIAKYQESVRAAMQDPEVVKKREAMGIPLQVQERRANIPERTQRLILDPTFEPETQAKMQAARKVWESDVQLGLSKLPIEPEVHAARIGKPQRLLDETTDVKPPDFQPGQIEPGYAPDVSATNLEVHTPRGKISKVLPFVKPGEEVVRQRGYGNRRVDPGAISAQNLFVPERGRYLADNTGETFMQGLFRADPGVWVEHAVRRERDLADKAFKQELVMANAAVDDKGEVIKFKSSEDFRNSGLADTHVLVNPDYPIAWFRAETNFTKEAARTIKALREAGDEANEQVVQQMIDNLTDTDAKAFISSHFMAMKRPGVAVPNAFFEYQKKLASVSDPFSNAVMRGYAYLIHKWRNTVLAYMPRWGLNTAIGSFVTNVVKGVVNPMDYVHGNRQGRMYTTDEGQVLTRPSWGARKLGAQDLNFAEQRLHKMEPAGVSLQGEARQEMLDSSQGRALNFPTQKLVAGVQHIEDFFRRASFQQSLRKEGKRWEPSHGAALEIDGEHVPVPEDIAADVPAPPPPPDVPPPPAPRTLMDATRDMPPEQLALRESQKAISEEEHGFGKASRLRHEMAQRYARNPAPGTHIFRGEARHEPGGVTPEDVGIHWTINGDAVLLRQRDPRPDEAPHQIVWHGVVDDPENQLLPPGAAWQGQHKPATFEAEVRLRPGSKVRLLGAYVWKGEGHPRFFAPFNPDRLEPGWEYLPKDEIVGTETRGHLQYEDVPGIRATTEPNIPSLADLHTTGEALPDLAKPERAQGKVTSMDEFHDIMTSVGQTLDSMDPRLVDELKNWSHGVIVGQANQLPSADKIYQAFEPLREELRQKYGDTLRLYRGVRGDFADDGRDFTSWTLNKAMARDYAEGDESRIITQQVPISDITAVIGDSKVIGASEHFNEFIVRKPTPEGTTENMGDALADTFKSTDGFTRNMQELLAQPRVVQRALRDTNKFGYNYGALGPDERRIVRQFMPFYGWYKFVSTLVGRLPIEYPGRTRALVALGQIGNDMYQDMGVVPDWIKGSIILGINPDGTIKYLPARGMNPFSSFFNPFNPGSVIQQTSGMFNPVIQAGLQGLGYDTLTGDSVRISPQSGVNRDFAGVLTNEKGEVVSPRQVQPITRALMGFARSIPAYRLGEKYMLEGGASVYPEHVPFGIQQRLMAPESSQAVTHGLPALSLSVAGINPRGYDLKGFQQLAKKRAKYIKTKNRNAIRKTSRKFDQAAP